MSTGDNPFFSKQKAAPAGSGFLFISWPMAYTIGSTILHFTLYILNFAL